MLNSKRCDVKPQSKHLNTIKKSFKENYQIDISDKEALECFISLFYLGRAIYKFNCPKGDKNAS